MDDKKDIHILNELFSDYQRRFIRFAELYVRDEAIAKDFVIEAIMHYWEKRDSLRPDSNIPAYILTIVKHKCLNHLEHIRVRRDVTGKMEQHIRWELQTRIASLRACEPEELFTGEARAIVDRTLMSLPEQTRTIFTMSRWDNMPVREIASHFGISVKAVDYHISKTLKALRKSLKDYLPMGV
ncbi:MAG: RNA polymerase sigma-70 factor [Alistipes sp.]|jgi:RNA polymerase sigma-70 factor (ECF subfamily)|nr:RNA polymerase sigma-70 factor [Alistipes sp.]